MQPQNQCLPASIISKNNPIISTADFIRENQDAITAIGTAVIALFTVVLGISTVKLWSATKNLVSGGEKTAELQLRAYLSVVRAEIINFGIGQEPRAKIHVKNCGQTPAKKITYYSFSGFDTVPPSVEPPNFNHKAPSEQVTGPGVEFVTTISLRRMLGEIEAKNLLENSHALYFIGQIKYVDIFGKERVTKFKMFANGSTGILQCGIGACDDGNNFT